MTPQEKLFLEFASIMDWREFSRQDWRSFGDRCCGGRFDRQVLQDHLLYLAEGARTVSMHERLCLLLAAHAVLPLHDQPLRDTACLLIECSTGNPLAGGSGTVPLCWIDILVEALAEQSLTSQSLASRSLASQSPNAQSDKGLYLSAIGDTVLQTLNSDSSAQNRVIAYTVCRQVRGLGYRPGWIPADAIE